jgi:hypothetical protein
MRYLVMHESARQALMPPRAMNGAPPATEALIQRFIGTIRGCSDRIRRSSIVSGRRLRGLDCWSQPGSLPVKHLPKGTS